MPEPSSTARLVGEILPDVYRFTIHKAIARALADDAARGREKV